MERLNYHHLLYFWTVARQVMRRYGVRPVGRIDQPTEHFHAVTGERRVKHSAVPAITQAARSKMFS